MTTEQTHRREQLDESKLLDMSRLGSWKNYKLVGNLFPSFPKDRETKQPLPQDGWLASVICLHQGPFFTDKFDIKLPMEAKASIPDLPKQELRAISDVIGFSEFSGWAKAEQIIIKGED